jgi:uracil DNA glycosylase
MSDLFFVRDIDLRERLSNYVNGYLFLGAILTISQFQVAAHQSANQESFSGQLLLC